MARGKTLTRLLDDLRAEARLSQNPAHNNQVRDSQIITLAREQERLWEDFDWPHLRVKRYIPVAVGQRYYDPASAIDAAGATRGDISIERIESISFKSDGRWLPVEPGIDAEHFALHDSALDSRSWPVSRWQVYDEDQIEVWPIPDTAATADDEDGYLEIVGIRNLNPLVEDADRADLDDRLIVLYVAGGILAASGAKDAQLKLELANTRYSKLKGNSIKTRKFSMFGVGNRPMPRRRAITRYRAPGS